VPWIDPYVKRDGTQVRGYHRSAPGGRGAVAVLALLVVAGIGSGNVTVDKGDGKAPVPKAVVYSVEHQPAPGQR
jgi:hypothetical protein